MDEVTTPETLPDGPQLSPADGNGADNTGSISLSALKEVLGKDFKDVDGALKSIKDTYSYVGSQAQYNEKINALATALNTDEQGVLSTIETLMEEINANPDAPATPTAPAAPSQEGQYVTKDDLFFMKNEDLADLRDVLTPVKNANEETKAMSWEQFVAHDNAKKILEPIKGYREMEAKKSVLDSSPRLGSATDKVSEARQHIDRANQAAQAGDIRTATQSENAARTAAVESVIDAFDLK